DPTQTGTRPVLFCSPGDAHAPACRTCNSLLYARAHHDLADRRLSAMASPSARREADALRQVAEHRIRAFLANVDPNDLGPGQARLPRGNSRATGPQAGLARQYAAPRIPEVGLCGPHHRQRRSRVCPPATRHYCLAPGTASSTFGISILKA